VSESDRDQYKIWISVLGYPFYGAPAGPLETGAWFRKIYNLVTPKLMNEGL
jgi:hypothetical protein